MMNTQTGKMIVFYGTNNLGKTIQAELLVKRLIRLGKKAEYIKYPIYDLVPHGPRIWKYLREENPEGLSIRQVQEVYTENRKQFQPTLLEKLENGVWVVAEDYTGTGLAWGGEENLEYLEEINKSLWREDFTILFDGERFTQGIEKQHLHENDDERMKRVRKMFQKLAWEKDWAMVSFRNDMSKEKIHQLVWEHVYYEFCHLLRE